MPIGAFVLGALFNAVVAWISSELTARNDVARVQASEQREEARIRDRERDTRLREFRTRLVEETRESVDMLMEALTKTLAGDRKEGFRYWTSSEQPPYSDWALLDQPTLEAIASLIQRVDGDSRPEEAVALIDDVVACRVRARRALRSQQERILEGNEPIRVSPDVLERTFE